MRRQACPAALLACWEDADPQLVGVHQGLDKTLEEIDDLHLRVSHDAKVQARSVNCENSCRVAVEARLPPSFPIQ